MIDPQLGEHVDHYKGDQGTASTVGTGALLCGLGLIAIVGAIGANGQIAQIVVFLGFAAFLFRIGGRTLFQWWRNRGVSVDVFEHGLKRVRDGEADIILWGNIRAVWQTIVGHYGRGGVYAGNTYFYTVETKDGQRFTFGEEILGIGTLGSTIQHEAHTRLYPRLLEKYERGDVVPFGPFNLSNEGVEHGKKFLTWAEIEGAKVEKGYIVFKQQGGWLQWANVAVGEIPNLPTFLGLINHILGLE
jgi:hypothetical protein